MTMPAHLAVLLRGWRHAVIGAAIVAVLAMAMRIHSHAMAGDGHGDGLVAAVAATMGDPPDGPHAPDEACDCPSVPALAAEAAVLLPVPFAIAGVRTRHPDDLPDSCSYPPDPPPARLG